MTGRYSKSGLWTLFLTCAFPIHVWCIILLLRDISWVSERTNAWDALGVISYGLVFALVESVVVFLLAAVAGLLISTKWDESLRIAILGASILVLSFWAIYSQSHFVWGLSVPAMFFQITSGSQHPVRILYVYFFSLVSISIIIPVFLILFQQKVYRFVQSALDRISTVTILYIFFDIVGFVIVIIRNF